MTLKAWEADRWLMPHTTTCEEVQDLLAVIDRDLADATVEDLSPDWRLGIAYNAALQVAMLALAAEGYRPSRDRAHERAILSLRFTLGMSRQVVDTIDGVRRKRNIINYERVGTTSDLEAHEVYAIAKELRTRVVVWLKTHHAELYGA